MALSASEMSQFKEKEQNLHDLLYDNVQLLTFLHAPSEEFKRVFKRDMFLKSNKSAFQQVIYYLLRVLNPDKIKDHITTWPIFVPKDESKFRCEVLKYLNEINTIYPDSNIPPIMASHLITPAGYKFVNFMLKLSQFVIYERLKNDTDLAKGILLPIAPSKDVSITEKRVQELGLITQSIEDEAKCLSEQLKSDFQEAKVEADGIVHKKAELKKSIEEKIARLEELQKRFVGNSSDGLDKKVEQVQNGMSPLQELYEEAEKFTALFSCLQKNKEPLEATQNDELVLNLNSLIETFNISVPNKVVDQNNVKDSDLEKLLVRSRKLLKKFGDVNKILVQEIENLQSFQKTFSLK